MATGYLIVSVVEQYSEVPIEDAVILVMHEKQPPIETKTNKQGLTESIPLFTVDKSLSLDPESAELPFYAYLVKVTKPEYREETRTNVIIFDGETTNLTVAMRSLIDLAAVREEVQTQPVDALFGSPFFPFPIIPITISVKLGAPDSDAKVIIVKYVDYIKNVVSCEIFPTWPVEAIRANIYAIQSLALNRVYTEWYRERGYDFQITSSTAFDMKFKEGQAVFSNISDLVDTTFAQYVNRIGFIEPLFTAFCDGKKVKCDGLHQWKTVDYANLGYDALKILQQFYGENIEIFTSALIQEVAESFPGDLKIGSAGPKVFLMQIYLIRISLTYPSIPQPFPLDGVFDDTFEESVKQFQRIFHLPVTGVIDRDTWYKISFFYHAVKRSGEIVSEGYVSLLDYLETPQTVKPGDRGVQVQRLQYALNVISQYVDDMSFIKMDTNYGPKTKQQVSIFQKHVGLPQTGIVDPKTWEYLKQYYHDAVTILPSTFELADFPGHHLTIGDEGLAVMAMQRSMNVIAKSYRTIPEVNQQGVFDQAMEDQVKAFQAEFNLPVTGIIDQKTWDMVTDIYKAVLPVTLYPGFELRLNDTNYYVATLQYYLNIIAEKFHNIPTSVVDPLFGPQTQASVIAFQKQFGLEPTGIVDKATWNMVLDIFTRLRYAKQRNLNQANVQ